LLPIKKLKLKALLFQADKLMPPPKCAPIKKRRSRRGADFISSRSGIIRQESASQPGTPKPLTKTNHRPASVSALTTGSLLAQTLANSVSPLKERYHHQQQQKQQQEQNTQQNDSDSDGACGFDSTWRESA
jgi:hypothetical protein